VETGPSPRSSRSERFPSSRPGRRHVPPSHSPHGLSLLHRRRPAVIPKVFSTGLGVQAATTPIGRRWAGAARPVIASRRRTAFSVGPGRRRVPPARAEGHGVALADPGEGLVGSGPAWRSRVGTPPRRRRGSRCQSLYAEASGCGRSLPESEISIRPDSIAWIRSQGTKADVVDPAGTLAAAVDDLGAEQVSQAHARPPAACR
jgi:hypothetical protein